jgi:arabinan endo-1,5-alpha-L-arabinosidase
MNTTPAAEVRIRDPFIVPVPEEKTYYMFGTTALRGASISAGPSFDCYTGTDLVNWTGPHRAFDPPADYWGTEDFWAAEVHRHRGTYYMFASFKAPGKCRGTDILISTTDSPAGPYVPHSDDSPITPHDWECLDGTLFIDEHGSPWMVFCHEWAQVSDGEICAVRLSLDLSQPIGKPTLLFTARQSGWSHTHDGKNNITDGPFLHRTQTGKLVMLWSSFHEGHYAMGVASSDSGQLAGPWRHAPKPLLDRDGGHGMLFRDFSGKLMLSLHGPNGPPNERPILFAIDDSTDELRIIP